MGSFWCFFLIMTTTITSMYCCRVHFFEPEDMEDYDYFDNYEYSENHLNGSNLISTHILFTCVNVSSIENLRPELYHGIPQLRHQQYLNITLSNISSILPSAFKEWTHLIKLYLGHNHIKRILPGAFETLIHLEHLYIDNNELEEVEDQVLKSLHKLKVLDLSYNRISTLDHKVFSDLLKLQVLNLRSNRLVAFDISMHRVYVKNVDLSENPLDKVSFINSSFHLEDLNLSNTKLALKNFHTSDFEFGTLIWSHNGLSKIDSTFPMSLKLDLSSNEISSIDNLNFLRSRALDLSQNKLISLNGTFPFANHLNLSFNRLEVLKSFFNSSDHAKLLDVSFNNISVISKDALGNLISLESLNISHNSISQIETYSFKGLFELINLDLSYNRIEKVQFGTFDALSNLQFLDLSHNKLTDISHIFHALVNLNKLYLDNNQISNLNTDVIQKNLKVISLDKNPLPCQNLVSLKYAFRHFHIQIVEGTTYDSENFHGIACTDDKFYAITLYSKILQKIFNNSISNSRLEQFFKKDFTDSKFAQYFDKDYSKSSFFKTLNEKSSGILLTLNFIVQLVLTILLIALMCFIFVYLKRGSTLQRSEFSSEMQMY